MQLQIKEMYNFELSFIPDINRNIVCSTSEWVCTKNVVMVLLNNSSCYKRDPIYILLNLTNTFGQDDCCGIVDVDRKRTHLL